MSLDGSSDCLNYVLQTII